MCPSGVSHCKENTKGKRTPPYSSVALSPAVPNHDLPRSLPATRPHRPRTGRIQVSRHLPSVPHPPGHVPATPTPRFSWSCPSPPIHQASQHSGPYRVEGPFRVETVSCKKTSILFTHYCTLEHNCVVRAADPNWFCSAIVPIFHCAGI